MPTGMAFTRRPRPAWSRAPPRARRLEINHLEDLAAALADGDPATQEQAARELGALGSGRAMMLLYEFVRDEEANADARQVAAEELLRLGLLRRERSGPSLTFIWLGAMTAVVVAAGAASILGPLGGVAVAAGAVVLGVIAMRGRGGEVGADRVYLGPEGERFRFAPDRTGADGTGTPWVDGGSFGDGGGGGGNGGGGV